MSCKEICKSYRAIKPKGIGRYAAGQKRCQVCEMFVNWDGTYCPCCGMKLRKVPRNSFYKQKLRTESEKII
ncbi:hypothetical protein [Candidatus Nitrosotenuis aquarius]|uniref:hypothetical protein n=1 Tax=Candidatus Nitrosotenuis aquarius TaxID=1846278 RepID=UPI000C1F44BF|nr:hypothetical protein [Candidatus Nitrosotenuis aquarius]